MDNLLSRSEQVIGLILTGKQSPNLFNADKLYPDYGKILIDIKKGMTKEDLYHKYTNKIQSAEHAAHSVNGLGTEMDWVALLDTAYMQEVVANELDKAKRFAVNGESDKLADSVRRIQSTINNSQRLRSVTADEITDVYTPYIKSGSKAIDTHIGGIPSVGVVVIGAKTYTGKTTVSISLMDRYLIQYPDREILFVTLEDMNEGWKHRANVILGNRSQDFWKRCRIMEFAGDVNEIIEEASRHSKVSAIFLDYIDYLADSSSVESYAEIYKTMSMGAKSLAVNNEYREMTIFLLAQFGKTLYKGGVPTPAALPYVDQQYIYLQIMLYSPEGDWYPDDDENAYTLPNQSGRGYLVCWKAKNSRTNHPDEFPGAIGLPWTSKHGYDVSDDGQWFSLASSTKREVKKSNRR
jgi:hypothetical protein